MKHIHSILLIAFLSTSFLSISQEKWQTYKSSKGNYTIQMPAGAEFENSEADENLTTQKLQTKEDDIIYIASVTMHEFELDETEELAKVSLESFVETVNGTIISQEVWNVKKRKGLMATVSLSDEIMIHYRVLIDGRRQFQVVAVTESKAAQSSKKIVKYFKSFKVA